MTRRLLCLMAAVLACSAALACRSGADGRGRVVVLGFDGLDYAMTRDLMARGRLPNFSRVAEQGGFSMLGTVMPPQSPVAWASFITGLDPGQTGIFDFVHRDPATMVPYLSTTRTSAPSHTVRIGDWQLPLSGGTIEALQQGRPFWDVLEQRGIETTIIRMPANFPPSGQASRELSGMGTPDILGTYGTFSFYTSDASDFPSRDVSGGTIHQVEVTDGVIHMSLDGPDHPYLVKPETLIADFTAYPDASGQYVKLVVGPVERLLRVGEWSDWLPIDFELLPTQRLRAEGRFFLKQLEPRFELYVTPLNLDPIAPALPISHPADYSTELALATGRFYSQGMPEETGGLRAGVLTPEEFLQQAAIAADENRRQYQYVLDRFERGLLFYYFGNTDQVSHMMWRPLDRDHPAYDPARDPTFERVVEERYVQFDAIVGETLAKLGPGDLLVVMSDHGFTSWRRSFRLNTWLEQEGYLVLDEAAAPEGSSLFEHVDWSRTRAYALGLNSLYLNTRGREAYGVVEPSEADALIDEISRKLRGVVDPATGLPAVTNVYQTERIFNVTGNEDIAPDMIVGYAKGTRSSDESALGGVQPGEAIVDNLDPWSGDHCMDAQFVPGILLTSRPLRRPAATLQTLAAAVLAEFGVDEFPLPAE